MIINAYGTNAPNPSVELRYIDESVVRDDAAAALKLPKFTSIIPVFADKGETNTLKLYRTGDGAKLTRVHGAPNQIKNGIGMDLAQMILSKPDSGVYIANLRGVDATAAVAFLVMKHKVAVGVPKVDKDAKPLFLTPEGLETIVSVGNTPILIDVTTVKYEVSSKTGISTVKGAKAALDALYSDTADGTGWKVVPVAAFMYNGSCKYGNNTSVKIVDYADPVTKKVLFFFDFFNGERLERLNTLAGFNPTDVLGTESLFFETVINNSNSCIKAASSAYIDTYISIIEKALAVDGKKISGFNYLGKVDCQSLKFDATSKDLTAVNAIKLQNGSDGDLSDKAAILTKFFRGEIIKDIFNPIRYQIRFLPDADYTESNLADIAYFLGERYGTVKAFLSIGDSDTYESGLASYLTTYSKLSLEHAMLLPEAASARRMNNYVSREVMTSFSYLWFESFMNKITLAGHGYEPFAFGGSDVTGFTPNTLECPTYTQTNLVKYVNSRINVPVAKTEDTVTMYTQLMCTPVNSDASELSNNLIMQDITYGLLNLIQTRMYKWGDEESVQKFQNDVKLEVEAPIKPYITSLETKIYIGNTPSTKSEMYIDVAVNCKDIIKRFKVSLRYVA